MYETAPGHMRSKVAASLDAVPPDARDDGVRAMALRYAELIDEAAVSGPIARAVRTLNGCIGPTKEEQEAWQRITLALSTHTVASDLGPKLVTALTALLLTPQARAATEPKGVNTNASPRQRLDELAAKRRDKSVRQQS